MVEAPNRKRYDLEDRTLAFAREVNEYIRTLPKDIPNGENGKQLVRAAGSVGANYIEANESFSRKISRKEAKESVFWLRLTKPAESGRAEQERLIQEAGELTKIFGSIVEKTK